MRVAIIHPWFPQYRRPFFDELMRVGATEDIEIDVFYGDPPPEWNDRGDSVSAAYATRLPTNFINFRGKHLVYKSPKPVWAGPRYDVIILEQAVRNLETYAIMLRRRGAKVAFWGHGRTYTQSVGDLQERVKQILTNRADWFFAYTDGGAKAAISAGFRPSRVTVVQNSIDSSTLRSSIATLKPKSLRDFEIKYDLKGKTGLFIGGLDESKRLSFLFKAAERAFAADVEFRLLVAGGGRLEGFVRDQSSVQPWLTYLGPLFGSEKALAMAASDVLLMPGRVGLVAVDSFASGTPIITTNWKWHAPEFEYLDHDINSVVAPDDEAAYAAAVVSTLNDAENLQRLSRGATESADEYTVAKMAVNFVSGLASIRHTTTSKRDTNL